MIKTQNALFKLLAAVAILCLAFSLSSFTVSAAEAESPGRMARAAAKSYLAVKGIPNTRVSSYDSASVRYNGTPQSFKSLRINGTYYVSVEDMFGALTNMSIKLNSSTRSITVSGNGLYMTATDGSYAVYANDRVLFDMTPARLMSDGKLYIPAKTAAKALGLSLSENSSRIDITGSVRAIASGAKFYDADAVYWLSRIISAESKGEPLIGQIAVGNVILNRVRSKSFPNTIWGVIFDRKYGVQFSPVANGTIYQTPAYTSVLAAKICLEGFSVSDEILYFLAPRYATSSWIEKNRDYVFTVKNHEFYS